MRVLFLLVSLSIIACSSDKPAPLTSPAGKISDPGTLFDRLHQTNQSDSLNVPAQASDPIDLGGSVAEDRAALTAIHDAIIKSGRWKGWLTRMRLDKWQCVETNAQGRVISLVLPCQHLQRIEGTLPQEIGLLTHLKHLEIIGWIEGGLPTQLGNLTQLEYLKITSAGDAPASWANLKNLRELYLPSQEDIPTWLGEFTRLEMLEITGGNTYRVLPAELGRLTNLRVLKAFSIKGPLPAQLSQLTQLDSLFIYSIQSAEIPPEWAIWLH